MRPTLRLTTAATLTAALILTASGCGDDDTKEDDAKSTPSQSSTDPSPTADPSAWTKKHSKQEVSAFDQALRRFSKYELRVEPAWRAGKATARARRLMEQNWYYPQWEVEFEKLRTYERSKIKRKGIPEVIWSKPKTLKKDVVIIRQCVDYADVEVRQDGKVLDPKIDYPYVRTIHMSKPAGHDFLISEIETAATSKKVERCGP